MSMTVHGRPARSATNPLHALRRAASRGLLVARAARQPEILLSRLRKPAAIRTNGMIPRTWEEFFALPCHHRW